jgi:CDP-diacylglycerol--glycerol-3-phosphate 3-phosphatidyltransferase
MQRPDYLALWSALHGGADPSGIVGAWLRLMHALAAPLVRLRIPPDGVTVVGMLVACAAPVLAGSGALVAAAAVVAGSAVLDSLDGAVAVVSGRTSRWGAVLDGVADRVSDAAFVAALWAAGAPGLLCVGAAALAWLQEYARARAGAAGLAEVTVLTANERPTRVIVVAMCLLAGAVRPADEPGWPTLGAWALAVLGVVGLAHLLAALRRRLSAGG